MDSSDYTLAKENYIWRYGDDCIFLIMHFDFPTNESRSWIMGLSFFHKYYVVYDMDNSTVGLAESSIYAQ